MSLHVAYALPTDAEGYPIEFDEYWDIGGAVDGYTKEQAVAIWESPLLRDIIDIQLNEDQFTQGPEFTSYIDSKELLWRFFNEIPYTEDSEVIPGTPNVPGLVDMINQWSIVNKKYRQATTSVEIIRTVDGVITDRLTSFN